MNENLHDVLNYLSQFTWLRLTCAAIFTLAAVGGIVELLVSLLGYSLP